MHKYILIGPMGAGKGTQAERLCREYDFVHISIGDIFRWHLSQHTRLAARITRIMNEGRLVPDEIVEEVVSRRLQEHDWNFGFVLDGFPRTRSQAEWVFEGWNMDKAIYLDIPDDVVYERVMKRVAMGQSSGFTKRDDDNAESLKVRLQEYYDKTKPLLKLFEEKQMLVTVRADRSIEEVYESILTQLGLGPPPSKWS